jgi:tellurium resistance protein TerD
MGVSLSKGGRVNLSKEAPGLSNVAVGLGWDINATDTGSEFDLDASVFMVDSSGKVLSDSHFVFYGNATSPDGAVEHKGDNKTGEGEGDDEVVNIDLNRVDANVAEIVFVVTIHEADSRGQNFGQVNNSYVRVVNSADSNELTKYELDEDYSSETAIEFGRLYKKDNEWRFKAVGAGFNSGLKGFCDMFGVATE